MTSSTHHIQVTKYHRGLRPTPMERIKYRDKVWLKYLKGKVGTSSIITDNKSVRERDILRNKLQYAIMKDRIIGIFAAIATLLLTYKLILAIY